VLDERNLGFGLENGESWEVGQVMRYYTSPT